MRNASRNDHKETPKPASKYPRQYVIKTTSSQSLTGGVVATRESATAAPPGLMNADKEFASLKLRHNQTIVECTGLVMVLMTISAASVIRPLDLYETLTKKLLWIAATAIQANWGTIHRLIGHMNLSVRAG